MKNEAMDHLTQFSMRYDKKMKETREELTELMNENDEEFAITDKKTGEIQYDINPVTGKRQGYKFDPKRKKEKIEDLKKMLNETYREVPVKILTEEVASERARKLPYVVREALYGIMFDDRHFTDIELELLKEDEILSARIPSTKEDKRLETVE
jgi:hypothetical protein